MIQSLPTIIIEIPNVERTLDTVNAALRAAGDPTKDNRIRRALDQDNGEPDDKKFENRFVHFMSMVVVPDKGDGRAHLIIEVNADGRVEDVLQRLAKVLKKELNEVLAAAGLGERNEQQLYCFLVEHNHDFSPDITSKAGLLFHGTPDLSVPRIKCEAEFAHFVRTELLEGLDDGTGVLEGSALGILRKVRQRVFADPNLKWAFVSEPMTGVVGEAKAISWPALFWSFFKTFLWPFLVPPPVLALLFCWAFGYGVVGTLVRALLCAAGAIVVLGLIIYLGYRGLRRSEEEDVPSDIEPDKAKIAALRRYEDLTVQNHLAGVSVMKPRWYRAFTLRFALWLIGESGAKRSQPGFIDKIGSIHFARWFRIPGTRKLVFLSNYDGSWQSYLEDFIARLREGLSSVWSNTLDFPKTKWLYKGGAGDGTRFKRWARRQQQPSECWYSAYPGLTTHRIRVNARIRNGFASAATEQEAEEWLSLFGYATRESLEYREIPTLVFGGLGRLPHARCLVLRLPANPQDAREWLGQIEARITYGDRAPDTSGLVVAFTAQGLEKLGLDEEALATFPMVFQEGMAGRARALGDAADKAWSTDALLMVYGKDEKALEDALKVARSSIKAHHVGKEHEIHLAKVEENVLEPFGFRDGVSQPSMRGTLRGSRDPNPLNVVEPGELVLGYRDNLQTTAPVPWVSGQEFGRNGSFLVVRVLEQNVDAFEKYLKKTADTLRNNQDRRAPYGSETLEEWIGAKMVGRWKNGTSLVRHPYKPGTGAPRVEVPGQELRAADAGKTASSLTVDKGSSATEEVLDKKDKEVPGKTNEPIPDNAFLFGREDPDGLRCPFGAHIRRANPRDSFEPGSTKQIDITNRHRILRVGRNYVEPAEAAKAEPKPSGLLFMCVQADIERQFEFLQQSWLLGQNFHGLVDESDPIVGCGKDRAMTIPTSSGPLRLRTLGEFVTFLGGDYFFMPSRSAIRMLAGDASAYALPSSAGKTASYTQQTAA